MDLYFYKSYYKLLLICNLFILTDIDYYLIFLL